MKLFQTQRQIAADTPEVVRVAEDDLAAVRRRRVVPIAAVRVRRDPVGGTVEQRLVAAALVLERHAHRMLLRLRLLVVLDEADHVVLPLRRGRMVLVGDLVEHVVEVVDGVDHLADVGFLERGDRRMAQFVDFNARCRRLFASPSMPLTLFLGWNGCPSHAPGENCTPQPSKSMTET